MLKNTALTIVLSLLGGCMAEAASVGNAREVLVVVGAGGTDEYHQDFVENAERWRELLTASGADVDVVGSTEIAPENGPSDRERVLAWIDGRSEKSAERWLVLIGHGTYQRKLANFNLVGPDISSTDLATAVNRKKGEWRIVVCASSSSPFLAALAGPDRIVVTATKSGSEQNLSLFGNYLAKSISNPEADLDHDGGVTLLEAFIDASGKLTTWYESENRLASEQALLDDNGDGRGTPAAFFRGVRAVKAAADGLQLDGQNANRCYLLEPPRSEGWTLDRENQVVAIEEQIQALRNTKSTSDNDKYYQQLEGLLMSLAPLIVE